jgi:hypothetical protein
MGRAESDENQRKSDGLKNIFKTKIDLSYLNELDKIFLQNI